MPDADPIRPIPPADASKLLTITTDRGTLEAWTTYAAGTFTACAYFVEALWPEAKRYVLVATRDKFHQTTIGWAIAVTDGSLRPVPHGPYELAYAVDLRRACEAALVTDGALAVTTHGQPYRPAFTIPSIPITAFNLDCVLTSRLLEKLALGGEPNPDTNE